MYRNKLLIDRGRCEHIAYPVEVLPAEAGKRKVAYCLGCGRTGPARENAEEALAALREDPRSASPAST